MNPDQAAPRYIQILAQSNSVDALPPANVVTKKGKSWTQVVKRIIIGRLGQGLWPPPQKYTGDTYNYQIDEPSRFSFRVAADEARSVWWSNVSLTELATLADYEAAILAVWHPPGPARWLRQLMIFAIPPAQLHAGIQDHLHEIVPARIRAALKKIVGDERRTPGLIPRLRDVLGAKDLQQLELAGRALQIRDQIAQVIDNYRVQQPGQLDNDAWMTAKKEAQKSRDKLFTVLIQIARNPNGPESYQVIHDPEGRRSRLILTELPADRFTSLQLGDGEVRELQAAYPEPDRADPPVAAPAADAEQVPEEDDPEPAEVQAEQNPIVLCVEGLREKLFGIPTDDIIARIWSAVAAGKHVVLTGAPGTAKTSIALEVASAAAKTGRCSTFLFTTATTDWTALDTVGGYVPNPARGERGLIFRPGKFLECFRDPQYNEQDFRWLVIDELNRAEVDKAFGQFFTVLSGHPCELPFLHDDRRVVIVPDVWNAAQDEIYDPEQFYVYRVPAKWRMLATLNTDDKASLFEMSYAFLRRFAFIHIPLPTSEGLDEICRIMLRGDIGLAEPQVSSLRSLWGAVIAVRPLGPALLIDMARYLKERADPFVAALWPGAVAEAVASFILPQLEGLTPQQLHRVRRAIIQQNNQYWTPALADAVAAFLPAAHAPDPIAEGNEDFDAHAGEDEE